MQRRTSSTIPFGYSLNESDHQFLKEIPENYEKMEHDVMNYDWGREIIIYYK